MSVFHNLPCDNCGETKLTVGLGPNHRVPGGDYHTEEVLSFCLDCLGVKSVEEWEARNEAAFKEQLKTEEAEYEVWMDEQIARRQGC